METNSDTLVACLALNIALTSPWHMRLCQTIIGPIDAPDVVGAVGTVGSRERGQDSSSQQPQPLDHWMEPTLILRFYSPTIFLLRPNFCGEDINYCSYHWL